ncbi:MAG: DUF368 domain-containing protein [Pseudobacteriovorax sp.]|nr:DUF368 domain-containing protein [Pseudobacteriovorax sp.]
MFMDILKGAALGVANIIPGVSGGTMALMLGIYERLISLLSGLSPKDIIQGARSKAGFIKLWREREMSFLLCLAFGGGVAIIALSKVMKYFLTEAHDPTYGFFFGLVFASIVVPWRLIRRKSAATILALVLGATSVVGVSFSVSPETRIEAAEKKLLIKQTQGLSEQAVTRSDYISFFIAGAIAISAMILPGLSGSFILLLMGVYFRLLEAISQLQISLLAVFAIGCGIGMLLFTKVLNWLLDKYHDVTMAYLTGLVVGSLYAVWPFKDFQMVGDSRINKANIIPEMLVWNTGLTFVSALVGIGIVYVFLRFEKTST